MELQDNLLCHHIDISAVEWLQIIGFGAILVPVRILLLFIFLLVTWPWFFMMRFSPKGRDLTWIELKMLTVANRLLFIIMGFRIKVKGTESIKVNLLLCSFMKVCLAFH